MKKILLLLGAASLLAACQKSYVQPEVSHSESVTAKSLIKTNELNTAYLDELHITQIATLGDGPDIYPELKVEHSNLNLHIQVYLQAYSSPGHNLPQIPVVGGPGVILLSGAPQNYYTFDLSEQAYGNGIGQPYLETYQKQYTFKFTKVIDMDTNTDITSQCYLDFPLTVTVQYSGSGPETGPTHPNPGGDGV